MRRDALGMRWLLNAALSGRATGSPFDRDGYQLQHSVGRLRGARHLPMFTYALMERGMIASSR
jgi:hypothetical protein